MKMKKYCHRWLHDNDVDIQNKTLAEINDIFSSQLLGITVCITFLIVLGIIGNAICLTVFLRRFKPSNYRTYVLVLATIDLTSSCTYMPGNLLFMLYPVAFTWDAICRLVYFGNSFLINLNHAIFLLIAIERYQRICQPFKTRVSKNLLKFGFIAAFIWGLLLSWPRLLFMGTIHAQLDELNVTMVSCLNNETFDGHLMATAYEIIVNSVSVLLSLVIITLYALVLKSSLKSKQLLSRLQIGNRKKYQHMQKTTKTLLFMTLIFLLLFFPYRFLFIVTYSFGSTRCLLHKFGGYLARLFALFMMGNHIVNPLIYGFWDTRFRSEIKNILCKRKVLSSEMETYRTTQIHSISYIDNFVWNTRF